MLLWHNERFKTFSASFLVKDSALKLIPEIPREDDRSIRACQHLDPEGHELVETQIVWLDFPKFYGDHQISWFFKVEQIFDYHQTAEDDRVGLAVIHLRGDTIHNPLVQVV